MIVPENDLPEPEMYYLYVFDTNGYHNGKVKVLPEKLEDTFHTIIVQAKSDGRKVIITDEWDNCMFHIENGEVIFPKSR